MHADRITAVRKGLWRAISGFATQITLNAVSVKNDLCYFCKHSYNSLKILQFESAQSQHQRFLMLSVNTPGTNRHTSVFTLCIRARKHFYLCETEKNAMKRLSKRTATTNNNLNVQGSRKHPKLAEQKNIPIHWLPGNPHHHSSSLSFSNCVKAQRQTTKTHFNMVQIMQQTRSAAECKYRAKYTGQQ